jgi:hypothetical protein
MKKTIKIIFLILILLILGSLIGIKIIDFVDNTKSFNKHKEYLDIDKQNLQIENWMTLEFISKKFEIKKEEIENEISKIENNNSIKLKLKDKKKPISEICEDNQIDCEILIENLNQVKK